MKSTTLKRVLSLALALVLTLAAFPILSLSAFAASGQNVQITYEGQIVDTFNGVPAKYIPGYKNSDEGPYSCAAYVKSYYSTIYGVSVSNLKSGRTPLAAEKGYSFKQISSGVVTGDIVRMPGHWAIVKSVSGNTLTLIEQNWKWMSNNKTYASVNRTVTLGSSGVVVFRLCKNGQPVNGSGTSATVSYQSHLANIGWQGFVSNEAVSGTVGQSRRMEAIQIGISGVSGGVTYQVHAQDYGWMGWKSNSQTAGTTGESRRMEAIRIKLTGEAAQKYHIVYRVHVQNIGWMEWRQNGETAGTTGRSLQIEAIQIKLVAK